jgi:hypothetical protein
MDEELSKEDIELMLEVADQQRQTHSANVRKTREECEDIRTSRIVDSLKELRSWLQAGEFVETEPVLGDQKYRPILSDESDLRAVIHKKAKELIEQL